MLGARTSLMHPPSQPVQPVFSVKACDGKARLGALLTHGGIVETPVSLLYTKRGTPPNLTPDMVQRLSPAPSAYQLDILQFLTAPTPETIKLQGKGARGFLSMDKASLLLASNRDPTMYEYGAKPSGDKGIYCIIHAGGRTVPPETYMEVVDALQPDLYVTMCDEITADAQSKHTRLSVKRTVEWLDSCLKLRRAKGMRALPLAAISGGCSIPDRQHNAEEAAKREVAGFALCGFGTGEEPGAQRQALLEAAVGKLPDGKPRFISGVSSPSEVLDAVALGLDVFDNSYVHTATVGGYALSFPFVMAPAAAADGSSQEQQQQQQAAASGADAAVGSDGSKVNLWSVAYRLDKGPMVPGCSCFTCSRHSRAYVHHLLQVHEMLAEVLLEMHNTHHYHAFMGQVRAAIQGGTFAQYHAWFKAGMGGAQDISVSKDAAAAAAPKPEAPAGKAKEGGSKHAAEEAAGPGEGPAGSAAKKAKLGDA